jgi:hypothetical protein
MPYELRARLYPIITAIAGIAAIYGIASEEQIAAWVGLAVALVGTSTATFYTRPDLD